MLQKLESIATQIIASSGQDVTMALPNLSIFQQKQSGNFDGMVYHPLFCVVLRGRKEFWVHGENVPFTSGDVFVISHDMPIPSKITDASPEAPYLSLILSLDLGMLHSLYDEVGSEITEDLDASSLSKGTLQSDWAEPLSRFLGLASKPVDAEILGPLILKELHFRLLMSPMGSMLRNLIFLNSHANRIAGAIQHIRQHFRETVTVADLASVANMSTSSFFEHFKSVTGATPLQYLKEFRLIEAHQRLLEGGWSVSSAGLDVGYESPSHFSRDYMRKFGCSPKQHLARSRSKT